MYDVGTWRMYSPFKDTNNLMNYMNIVVFFIFSSLLYEQKETERSLSVSLVVVLSCIFCRGGVKTETLSAKHWQYVFVCGDMLLACEHILCTDTYWVGATCLCAHTHPAWLVCQGWQSCQNWLCMGLIVLPFIMSFPHSYLVSFASRTAAKATKNACKRGLWLKLIKTSHKTIRCRKG